MLSKCMALSAIQPAICLENPEMCDAFTFQMAEHPPPKERIDKPVIE